MQFSQLPLTTFQVRCVHSHAQLVIYLTFCSKNYLKTFRDDIETTSVKSLNEDQQKELQHARDTVKDYSDELVNGWNQDVDGLLTFVRVSYHVISVQDLTLHFSEWSLFCDPHCIHRPILSAPPTGSTGSYKRYPRPTIRPDPNFCDQSLLRQLHSGRVRSHCLY